MFGWQFQGIARFASSSSQPISHGACDHPKHKLYATRSEIRESFSEDEIKLDLFSIIESLFYDLLSNCSPFVSDEWERQINWRLISTRSRSNFRRTYKVLKIFQKSRARIHKCVVKQIKEGDEMPTPRKIINNCNVFVFARGFIFGIRGDQHQLSSIINIVTFDAACECESDALRELFQNK